MRLQSRQVEAFRALMLSSSTVRAAESLHISQPAVSRLVRDLQEALGLTLFERRGTRLVPTSEAIALYAEVERSFVGLERIAQAARDVRERRAGVLRVAAMPALCNGVLPRFAGAFLAEHDQVGFALEGLISSAVLDRVVNEQCDIGFAAAPIEHAAVAHRKMPSLPYVAVVPEGHRLARRRVLRPRDFAGETFIRLGPTTPSRFRIDDVFSRHGIDRPVRIETPLSEIACALVAAGAGVSIVDPFTAREYATRGVVARAFEPVLQFQVAALYPAHRSPSPVARDFIDGFARFLAETGDAPRIQRARQLR
jgi:DNA-binding transcriptional LysR family regulator